MIDVRETSSSQIKGPGMIRRRGFLGGLTALGLASARPSIGQESKPTIAADP